MNENATETTRTHIPGVGVLHTITLHDGHDFGVLSHRAGHVDLISAVDPHDAEQAASSRVVIRLTESQASQLSALLRR